MGITPARMCGTSLVLNHVGVNEDSQSGQRQLAWKTQQTGQDFFLPAAISTCSNFSTKAPCEYLFRDLS
jgi:hypothetical protein